MDEYFDLLSASPLFQGIGADELESMLHCLGARILDVPRGEPVFLEGDSAGFIGIVLQGGIQVVPEDFFGNRSVIHHSQEGDIFAEAFSFTGLDTMPVSGYAVKNSRVRAVIGGGRWRDNAVAASVSLVTLWPLAITSVVGTAWQILLNAQLRRRLMTYSR